MMMVLSGWTQSSDGTPMVVFLEPAEGSSIPSDWDSVQIRFRLISPDNTNLMRYQPFVNGLPGNDPIPIDPPSPQVELTILWRGLKQFPDGVHIITIKVVDAKGREGMGSLTLYKGRDSTKPTAEILHPKSGDTLRGQVPILIRVSDDRGVKGIAVNATRRETSKTQTIYIAAGDYGRFMEVRVIWDTTEKHPETKEDLFPDGIYLLQAKVRDQEGNEGVSNEVLVIVQNKVAQPLISQVSPGQTTRGGAAAPTLLPETQPEPKVAVPLTTSQLLIPSGESKPAATEGLTASPAPRPSMQVAMSSLTPQPRLTVALPSGESRPTATEGLTAPSAHQLPMQVAMSSLTPQPRLTVALPPRETVGQRAYGEPTLSKPSLPSPKAVGVVPASTRPSLGVTQGESKVAATYLTSQPTLPPTILNPQIVAIGRVPMSAPAGQTRLVTAWLPPSPRTLQRAQEISDTPKVAPLASMPRLPAPEIAKGRESIKRIPRQIVSMQPSHSFRYTVVAGDTLYGLAERFGISVQELAAANGLPENAPLRIGQRLIIPARPVTVLVDGKLAECEVPAFVRNGTTVGSFRAVIEASGGIVGWDNERKQAIANLGSLNLVATIGKDTLEVNGEQVPLSIAPFLLRNRTFLPLRELGISLGKEVKWDKGALLIETPKR